MPRYGKILTVESPLPVVNMTFQNNSIEFSSPTQWELYSNTGEPLESGYGSTITQLYTNYGKGRLYVNFDNETQYIKVRKP